MEPDKTSSLTVALISVLLGIGAGFGGSVLIANQLIPTTPVASQADAYTKAANLRVELNTVFSAHAGLSARLTRATLDGAPYLDLASASLDENSSDLQKLLADDYGEDKAKQVRVAWDTYTKSIRTYAEAIKGGDQTAITAKASELNTNIEKVIGSLAELNPQLSKANLKKHLDEHIGLVKSVADAYRAGEYAKSFEREKADVGKLGQLADQLAQGAISQFNDKYKEK
ncbi:MAG TPA: hypothetical protein VNA68_02940 [Candidatus Dormibacteraeota bacterium]|nr:hypothetical protein [Candidatus Dormibacteraeota bacterium]